MLCSLLQQADLSISGAGSHSLEQPPGTIEMRRLPGQEGAAGSYSVIEFSPKNLSVRLPNRQNGGVAFCRSVSSGIEAELRYPVVHT